MRPSHATKLVLDLLLLLPLVSCGDARREVYAVLDAGGLSYGEVDGVWAKLPYERIVLEQQSSQPWMRGGVDYRLDFEAGGVARLNGVIENGTHGDFVGEIRVWDYGSLCELIEASEIERLKDRYDSGSTHQTTYTLRLESRGGGMQTIESYGGIAPIEFWGVTRALKGVMQGIDWTSQEEDPAPGRNHEDS